MKTKSVAPKQLLIGGVALLALAFSAVSVSRSCSRSRGPHAELTDGLGVQMGALVARSIGRKVVVVDYPGGASKLLDGQKTQFIKSLERNGVKVEEVVILEIPSEAVGERYLRPEEYGITVSQYVDVAQRFPDVDAIVSIAGALRVNSENLEEIPEGLPPLVVTYSQSPQPGLETLMDRGILAMVIQPLPAHELQGKGKPESPKQWLEEYFEVKTADDVAREE